MSVTTNKSFKCFEECWVAPGGTLCYVNIFILNIICQLLGSIVAWELPLPARYNCFIGKMGENANPQHHQSYHHMINRKSKKETRCYIRKSVGMNNFVVRDESMKTCFYRNMSSPLSARSVPLIRKISFSKCNYTSSKESEKFHISPIYQSCSLTSTNCCRLQFVEIGQS